MCPQDHKTPSYSTLARCTFDTPAFLLSEAPALCDMNPIHVASSCPFRLLAANARSPNSLWQRINLVSRVPWWWWGRPGLMLRESTCNVALSSTALAYPSSAAKRSFCSTGCDKVTTGKTPHLMEVWLNWHVREVSSLDAPQSKFLLRSLNKRMYNSTINSQSHS